MPHWRRQYDSPRWIENGTAWITGTVAVVVYFAFVIGALVLMFVTTPKAKAATVCQPNQIEGLAELAKDLSVKPSPTPTIATGIGCDGKPYDFVALLRAHTKMMKDKK